MLVELEQQTTRDDEQLVKGLFNIHLSHAAKYTTYCVILFFFLSLLVLIMKTKNSGIIL